MDNVVGFLEAVVLIIGFAGVYIWKGYREQNAETSITNAFNKYGFVASKSLLVTTSNLTKLMAIDKRKKQLGFGYNAKNKTMVQIYEAEDIVSVEVIEDNDSIIKTSTSNMVGRAIVGGALVGGVGAVIGGTTASKTSKQIVNRIIMRIMTADLDDPVKDIAFLNKSVEKNSPEYNKATRQATEWHGLIKALMHQK